MASNCTLGTIAISRHWRNLKFNSVYFMPSFSAVFSAKFVARRVLGALLRIKEVRSVYLYAPFSSATDFKIRASEKRQNYNNIQHD